MEGAGGGRGETETGTETDSQSDSDRETLCPIQGQRAGATRRERVRGSEGWERELARYPHAVSAIQSEGWLWLFGTGR